MNVAISIPLSEVRSSRSIWREVFLGAFLLTQCFDGVLTYIGVTLHGTGIEANPLIATLMEYLGTVGALMAAKSISATLGIALYLREAHVAVAALAVFYLVVAVLPWIVLLF